MVVVILGNTSKKICQNATKIITSPNLFWVLILQRSECSILFWSLCRMYLWYFNLWGPKPQWLVSFYYAIGKCARFLQKWLNWLLGVLTFESDLLDKLVFQSSEVQRSDPLSSFYWNSLISWKCSRLSKIVSNDLVNLYIFLKSC